MLDWERLRLLSTNLFFSNFWQTDAISGVLFTKVLKSKPNQTQGLSSFWCIGLRVKARKNLHYQSFHPISPGHCHSPLCGKFCTNLTVSTSTPDTIYVSLISKGASFFICFVILCLLNPLPNTPAPSQLIIFSFLFPPCFSFTKPCIIDCHWEIWSWSDVLCEAQIPFLCDGDCLENRGTSALWTCAPLN